MYARSSCRGGKPPAPADSRRGTTAKPPGTYAESITEHRRRQGECSFSCSRAIAIADCHHGLVSNPMDQGHKCVALIAASILAARNLAQLGLSHI